MKNRGIGSPIHNYGLNGKAEIKEKKLKFCNKCKIHHDVLYFGIDLERTDGLSNKCRKTKRREE